jgi:uncharacterized protein (DUF362 family)
VSGRFTRRELAVLAGAGVLAGTVRPSRAIAARPGVVGTASVDPDSVTADRCQRAMATALAAATGAESAQRAVASLFRPDDTVGIKLNCLSGPRMSPRVELVEALVELIATSGVERNRIIVFERSSRELTRAGFKVRRSGGPYLCYGTDNDYDRYPSTSGDIGSCFARLVSAACTALVSFGVVKDHDLAGVSAGLKNWYGVIHNPNKYHDSNCNPYVADVVQHPHVRSKLRLTVLDGIEAQCQGGPALYRGGLFALGKVAASTDPVAADLWAWQELDAERARRGMATLQAEKREPRFISTAARYGLGVGDPKALQRVEG